MTAAHFTPRHRERCTPQPSPYNWANDEAERVEEDRCTAVINRAQALGLCVLCLSPRHLTGQCDQAMLGLDDAEDILDTLELGRALRRTLLWFTRISAGAALGATFIVPPGSWGVVVVGVIVVWALTEAFDLMRNPPVGGA